MHLQTFKIEIKGQVQGVGFRPFVFNLAQQQNIVGCVYNNEEGVLIKISGTAEKANAFLEALLENPPPVSIIRSHQLEEIAQEHFNDFRILSSAKNKNINIPLTPDFAICKTCKTEIKDKNNRRFGYPFTTCVNCGPRYAITKKFPFERTHTSMVNFEMCNRCQAEYTNPTNRRFHAQTNSCFDCGIQLTLVDTNGKELDIKQDKILQKAAELIDERKIIAIKNTNGYLLCCDANNETVIKKLREKKQRPSKPFAVLYPTIESVEKDFELAKQEKKLLCSSLAPILILPNTQNKNIATQAIAPKLKQTGVMLPSSALLQLLMNALKKPIVCTSGNVYGSPIIAENKKAQESLKPIADYFVHHNLLIQFPQDDSVLKVVDEQQIIVRRSRGLAPNYLMDTTQNEWNVLAMGAHLKSTFALIPNAHIYVSQYFGNLDNYDVAERYKKTIHQQLSVFNCSPKIVLVDAHPSYQSGLIGEEIAKVHKAQIIKIQHHKAHFASVLGEHELFDSDETIMGVVWDGTGYGEDAAIWGGEFFIYENQQMERMNHVEYYDWIANDKMAKEPRLALLSLLGDADHRELIQDKFTSTEWKVYSKMFKTNTLKTSSVGRLFDAVASALDICDKNTFEAEAAMLLENCATSSTNNDFIDLLTTKPYTQIPAKLLVKIILKSYLEGVSKSYIAGSFIFTLANAILNIAQNHHIKIIACSGGVFQNALLIKMLIKLCRNSDIKLKINRKLSPNDENISFGQLMYFQYIKN